MKEDQPEICEHLCVLQEGSPQKNLFFAGQSMVMEFEFCPNLDVPPTTVQKLR